jgi:hypothetical protein
MIAFHLLSLALLSNLHLESTSPQKSESKPAEANVVKVYELSSALPGLLVHAPPEPLLPYLTSIEEEGGQGPWDPMFGADTLVELLRSLCGDEFDYEGREIVFDGHGRLIVKAPPALQARTERYLAFLESVFGASTELSIDALDLSDVPDGEAAVPALIPVSDIEKLLARSRKGGVRSWRLILRAGDTAHLDLTRVASMVTDYDVEVAQASAIADPIVEDVPVGTRIFARAAPAAGGMWLSLILRRGDPLSDVQDRENPTAHEVTTQDRLVYPETTRVYQSIDVLNRSLALSTYLPEGKALAIQSAVISAGKPHAEILIVRRSGGALPIFKRISLDPKAPPAGEQHGEILFVNAQSAEPPRCEIKADPMTSGAAFRTWTMIRARTYMPDVSAWFPDDSFDVLREVISAGNESLRIRDVGPCLFLTRESSGAAPPQDDFFLGRKDSDGLDRFTKYAPAARVVQVSVALRRGGNAAPVARCILPLRPGEPAIAVLGSEGIEIADYNVEVAQSSNVADPVMRVAFDGVELWLKPAFALSGDLTLEVAARAHIRRGEGRQLDLKVPSLGKLDESTYDQLTAHEKLVFGKGEGAPRRFVLGDSAAEPETRSLALEIEAVEIK